jgi:hypothetical protein
MNGKIVIPVSIIITIVIVVFSLTQNGIIEKQTSSEISDSSEINVESEISDSSEINVESEIQSKIDKIKADKIENDNSYQPFIPTQREWIQAGPFQIDKSEYALGEKIFVNIKNLNKNAKGTMVFTKIVNSTHIFEYKKIDFDGSKPQQNFYLGINLFDLRKICTADQLIGDWELRFVNDSGLFIDKLDFKINNQIIPGKESKYEAVC